MARDLLKVLGQAIPAAGVLTDTYFVPNNVGYGAVISSIVVCNESTVPTTFRISVAVAAAVDATKQYLYYDTPINANSTLTITLGLALGPLDTIRTQSNNGLVAFGIFGVETT